MKFFVYFVGIVLSVVILFYIGIYFFISDYYYYQKVQFMDETVSQIDMIYELYRNPLERLSQLEYLGMGFEGKISIYDNEKSLTIADEYVLNYSRGTIINELKYNDLNAYIYETSFPVKGSRWLIYIDTMKTGEVAILQIPVIAIDKSVQVIFDFIFYMLGFALVIAIVASVILSGNITKPIKKLYFIAKEISKLNFNVKYNENRRDEIGQLGHMFNDLTDKLQTTIDDLHKELLKEKQIDALRKGFIAQVSHELQTPLSIINGYVEALQDGIVESDEECQDYYEVIRDESGKMSRMIKELLQLSELEAGTFKLEMRKLDLRGVLQDVLVRYKTMLMHQPIELVVKLTEESVMISGDEEKLVQGIANILNNAIKHTKVSGKIYITLTKECLIIENEGEPINEEDLPWIWDSFYKGKKGNGKSGIGLGLAIASRIFRSHKISYTAKNTELGVAFKLMLAQAIIEE